MTYDGAQAGGGFGGSVWANKFRCLFYISFLSNDVVLLYKDLFCDVTSVFPVLK